jgi:hypothetical protein
LVHLEHLLLIGIEEGPKALDGGLHLSVTPTRPRGPGTNVVDEQIQTIAYSDRRSLDVATFRDIKS